MFGIDIYYLVLVVPAIILSMYAQSRVSSTFKKYSGTRNAKGYTAAQVAQMIMNANGIMGVRIEHVKGNLTDHYDPRNNVVRLSDTVYGSPSIAALGVAAHEIGHVIQHQKGYAGIALRNFFVPVANIGSTLAMPMIIIGFLLGSVASAQSGVGPILVRIGIIMYAAVVAFHIITLPVEFNASNRALSILESENILSKSEIAPAKKVLGAAALTYVAAAAVAIANLIRIILVFNNSRRRD